MSEPEDVDSAVKLAKAESELKHLRRLKARNERIIRQLLSKEKNERDRPQTLGEDTKA